MVHWKSSKGKPRKVPENFPRNTTREFQTNIGGMAIFDSKCENFMGIQIDNKLTFESYVPM